MTGTSMAWSILGPALLAGLLVLVSHVPLGQQVLARGIVFIDLAIAQIAALGVIAVDAAGLPATGWVAQAAALGAALAGAALLSWSERRAAEQQEALIGVVFVLAACAGLLLLAGNPHGGEHLKDLLIGQILWVSPPQLGGLAGVTALWLLLRLSGLAERCGRFGFYGLFALAVTASVQLVGVYLVFSSLVIPALATARLHGRRRVLAGYAVGALGYSVGLAASAWLDLPSGAVIVWALALSGMACRALTAPR